MYLVAPDGSFVNYYSLNRTTDKLFEHKKRQIMHVILISFLMPELGPLMAVQVNIIWKLDHVVFQGVPLHFTKLTRLYLATILIVFYLIFL